MRAMRVVVIAASALANTVGAQSSPTAGWPLDSGSKVRVVSIALGRGYRTGSLQSSTADSLVIRGQDVGSFSVATQRIDKLEVSSGTHTRKVKGALFGFVIGALGGAAIGAATYKPKKCPGVPGWCNEIFGQGFSTAFGAMLGAIPGTLMGLIVGSSPTDTWVPVKLPDR